MDSIGRLVDQTKGFNAVDTKDVKGKCWPAYHGQFVDGDAGKQAVCGLPRFAAVDLVINPRVGPDNCYVDAVGASRGRCRIRNDATAQRRPASRRYQALAPVVPEIAVGEAHKDVDPATAPRHHHGRPERQASILVHDGAQFPRVKVFEFVVPKAAASGIPSHGINFVRRRGDRRELGHVGDAAADLERLAV